MKKDNQFNENKEIIKDQEIKFSKKELDDNELDGVTGGTDVLEIFKTIKDIITK